MTIFGDKVSRNGNRALKYVKAFDSVVFRGAAVILLSIVIYVLTHGVQGGNLTPPNLSLNPASKPVATTRSPKAVAVGPEQTDANFAKYPTWSQDFSDYKSSSLSSKYWNVNEGVTDSNNDEAEYYTGNSANLRISNGALVMEAKQQNEPDGLDYSSSRVDTMNKVSFLYGRMDVVAKLPTGVGTWPAIWFLPANNKYEDKSPASNPNRYLNGGEIDMVEAVGAQPGAVYGIVHSLEASESNKDGVGDYNVVNLESDSSQYYLYSMLWTPTSITLEINDVPFFSYARPVDSSYVTWPFDQPFYLIMNLALGGTWGGEDTTEYPGNGIDNSALPASLDIKSINYYKYIGSVN
jgi:beta-glucanase (GH16 family)